MTVLKKKTKNFFFKEIEYLKLSKISTLKLIRCFVADAALIEFAFFEDSLDWNLKSILSTQF